MGQIVKAGAGRQLRRSPRGSSSRCSVPAAAARRRRCGRSPASSGRVRRDRRGRARRLLLVARRLRPAEPARLRHGVPVLCDLAAHERRSRTSRSRSRSAAAGTRAAEIGESVMRVAHGRAARRCSPNARRRSSPAASSSALALARALVMEPALLLLDEPLSNLDAKLREQMRFELKRLQRELSITTVYVTHDQSEALALSHQIAVMNEGASSRSAGRGDLRAAGEPVRRRLRGPHQLHRGVLGRSRRR